jgi:hypothetical protein
MESPIPQSLSAPVMFPAALFTAFSALSWCTSEGVLDILNDHSYVFVHLLEYVE